MIQSKSPLSRLLHRGAVKEIAQKLGMSSAAVSAAIKIGRPSHPAVNEALKIIEASGVLVNAQQLANLTTVQAG